MIGTALDRARTAIVAFVVLGEAEADALALWVAHTWLFFACEITPYVWVSSATKRAGKTTLCEVLKGLVCRPMHVAGSITEAVLFRVISDRQPTLLIDEADAIFTEKPSDLTEPLRAALNAGHRRGAKVPRCVGPTHEIREFDVHSPKLIAGIGSHLPDTIIDRSIRVRLARKTPGDVVTRARWRELDAATAPVRELLEALVTSDVLDRLAAANPTPPAELDDRGCDIWEPLFAIADEAGGDWPARARRAAVRLSNGEERVDTSPGVELLATIRQVLDSDANIGTGELIRRLASVEEAPFTGWWNDDRDAPASKPWAPRRLAKMLREFQIEAKKVRTPAGSVQGYSAGDFADAFARYLPRIRNTGADSAPPRPHGYRDVPDVPDVGGFAETERRDGLLDFDDDPQEPS